MEGKQLKQSIIQSFEFVGGKRSLLFAVSSNLFEDLFDYLWICLHSFVWKWFIFEEIEDYFIYASFYVKRWFVGSQIA